MEVHITLVISSQFRKAFFICKKSNFEKCNSLLSCCINKTAQAIKFRNLLLFGLCQFSNLMTYSARWRLLHVPLSSAALITSVTNMFVIVLICSMNPIGIFHRFLQTLSCTISFPMPFHLMICRKSFSKCLCIVVKKSLDVSILSSPTTCSSALRSIRGILKILDFSSTSTV